MTKHPGLAGSVRREPALGPGIETHMGSRPRPQGSHRELG